MRAVILAAGQGTRLRPLTDHTPKCMVPFMGQPLVERSLAALAAAGVSETVFVVGYCAAAVEAAFGACYAGMHVRYVIAADYATTNNIVSLWQARHVFADAAFLLLEGDLIYDAPVLARLLAAPADNVAVVDPFAPGMNGSVVLAAGDRVTSLVLGRDQGADFDYRAAFKTVNIYRFGTAAAARIAARLDAWVQAGRTNEYYEATFAEMIAEGTLHLHLLPIAPQRWAETDTVEDLRQAERLFA